MIYSTKNRARLITRDIRDEQNRYLSGIFNACESPAIIVNSVEDHVHCLFVLSKNYALSKVVEEVKKGSSKWIKSKGVEFSKFHWQSGYGGFSVSQSHVDAVREYIANQEEHHRKKTFREEYIDFLKKFQVPYDERFLFE